jgi:hypothetical protein
MWITPRKLAAVPQGAGTMSSIWIVMLPVAEALDLKAA